MSATAIANLDLQSLSSRYLAAWRARDIERILALHDADTRFVVHAAGGEPAVGRGAVRAAFAALFEQWPNLAFEDHRLLLGERHWVLDWTLRSSGGPAGEVGFGCLDVVTVSAAGLVQRKDTYIDLTELDAALGRA